jgi:hypothetical protein
MAKSEQGGAPPANLLRAGGKTMSDAPEKVQLGPFGGPLVGHEEQVAPGVAAALRGALEAGEVLAATAALAPWTVDDARGVVVHAGPLGAACAPTLVTVAAAAAAIADLHARGRVHGDVRPETLRQGPDGAQLVVAATPLDAPGLLRARLGAGLLAPDALAYAAPEVVRGQAATAASDVYSLAALAHHAITGSSPLGQLDLPALSKAAGDLTPVLSRALSASPARRPELPALTAALIAASSRVAAEVAPEGFELVDAVVAGGAAAPKARLVTEGAPARLWKPRAPGEADEGELEAAPKKEEGAQVSAILMLVWGLGGLFVLVGAIGLALVLGSVGVFLLLVLLTVGAFFGGRFAEQRGSAGGGLALIGVSTQLLWADAAYVLTMLDLLAEPLPWVLVGAGVATVTGILAQRRESLGLWVLAGFGALVACACLWSSVGPGGRALLIAMAAGGLVFGGHQLKAAGKEPQGLPLIFLGCFLFLGVAAQVLDLVGQLDEAMPWALAAGVAAAATGLVALQLRTPGLWAIAALQALVAGACLWSGLSDTGRGLLSLAGAVALVAGAVVLLRLESTRKTHHEAIALAIAGTCVGWISAWHLLSGARLLGDEGAWTAAAALITLVTYGLVVFARSAVLSALAALYLAVTAAMLGDYLSTGTLLGPSLYTGAVCAVFLGVAFLLHRLGGRALGASPAAGACLWAVVSAICGLVVLDRRDGDVFGVAWPLGLTALAVAATVVGPRAYRLIAALAMIPLVAFAPTTIVFLADDAARVGYLQLAVFAAFAVIAAGFWAPGERTLGRQLLLILPALLPATFPSGILCLAECAGKDGLQLLLDAVASGGRVHETPFAYLASVVGISGVLVGLAFLFASRAASRAGYRVLEGAGLLLFFGTTSLLSFFRLEDWFYPGLIFGGGALVIALGAWQRRALLVASATPVLVLHLWVQYFAKLNDHVPTFGLVLGFGVGLMAFGLLFERRVKHALPSLREWD